MKKIYNKIVKNIFSFTIFMVIIFFIVYISVYDIFSNVILNSIFMTSNGVNLICELVLFLLIIPLIFIFKNKYVFIEKKVNFFKSLIMAWPMLILAIIIFVGQACNINFSEICFYELLALLIFCILIGLAEEFLCRGWLQNEFIEKFGYTSKKVIYCIFISSILFGLMHVANMFAGQSVVDTFFQVINAVIGGLFFGIIYFRTKNIWSVVFIHAFWDFALFFGNINEFTTCVHLMPEHPLIVNIVFNTYRLILMNLPLILYLLVLFNKIDINKCLIKEQQILYDDAEIISTKQRNKILIVIIIIYIVFYGFIMISSSISPESTCPNYYELDNNDYNEFIVNMKNKNILVESEQCVSYIDDICIQTELSKSQIKIFINDENNLEFVTNSGSIILKYMNVDKFAIIDNGNNYDILVSSYYEESDAYIIYYSSYLNDKNINRIYNLKNDFVNSFSQLMLPSIMNFGYCNEFNNSYNYPLLISEDKTRYVLYGDGVIYKYNLD